MLLNDKDIQLRAIEPEDLDILYRWENSTDLWIHGNTLAPYSKLMLRQYINDSLEMDIFQSRQLRLMIDLISQQKTIGTIDLYEIDPHNRRAGIGILIDEEYRQRGYAYQALSLMERYTFDHLYLHQLFAYISTKNKPSIDLFTKSGYKEIGVLSDWIQKGENYEDVIIVQLINNKKK